MWPKKPVGPLRVHAATRGSPWQGPRSLAGVIPCGARYVQRCVLNHLAVQWRMSEDQKPRGDQRMKVIGLVFPELVF